jgi:cell division septal protein FtsQ
MQKKKKKRTPRKSDKFWAGSGKFFLAMIFFYGAFVGITELVEHAKSDKALYGRNDIEISGNEIINKDDILRLCGFEGRKQKEIEIDIQELADKIMDLKFIKGVSVTRRLPRKLNITVEERSPIAFIYGKGLNLIDREGYLIPIPKLSHIWDAPMISGITENLGVLGRQTIAPEAYIALEMLEYMRHTNPIVYGFISEINMSNPEFFDIFLIRGGINIRINRTDYRREIFILKSYLVNYLNWEDLRKIEYIDLRFRDQLILRYKA